jgi:hypothetical protein
MIDLSKINTQSGNLAIVENQLPFSTLKGYFIYMIFLPANHAVLMPTRSVSSIFGSGKWEFRVVVEDCVSSRTVFLNQPHFGLHIPPGVWAHEQNFSSGAICLVLASHGYDESDYIRNYEDFKKFRGIQ